MVEMPADADVQKSIKKKARSVFLNKRSCLSKKLIAKSVLVHQRIRFSNIGMASQGGFSPVG